MIAKAKAISHGINGIRYITGESHNKKHPETQRFQDALIGKNQKTYFLKGIV